MRHVLGFVLLFGCLRAGLAHGDARAEMTTALVTQADLRPAPAVLPATPPNRTAVAPAKPRAPRAAGSVIQLGTRAAAQVTQSQAQGASAALARQAQAAAAAAAGQLQSKAAKDRASRPHPTRR